MRNVAVTLLTSLLLVAAGSAHAELLVLQPDPLDLYDLDHQWCYTWGISIDQDASPLVIEWAELEFDDIRNWNDRPNVLYVHLLDSAPDGVTTYRDKQGKGNNFDGQGIELVTYVNLPSTAQDLVHTFTPDQLTAMNAHLQNGGNLALGFDPDCHFHNRGVSLKLGLSAIPEPACMTVILTGAAFAIKRRRR